MAAYDAAFSAFVRERQDALIRVAFLLTGHRSEAEDLVQDTLLAVYRRWDSIAAPEARFAYAKSAMTRKFISRTRLHRFRREVVSDQLDASPVTDKAAVEDRQLLFGLLQQLGRRERAAVVLRHYVGLSDSEAAAVMGCGPGSVKAYASRGLAKLNAHVATNTEQGMEARP